MIKSEIMGMIKSVIKVRVIVSVCQVSTNTGKATSGHRTRSNAVLVRWGHEAAVVVPGHVVVARHVVPVWLGARAQDDSWQPRPRLGRGECEHARSVGPGQASATSESPSQCPC